MIKSLTNYQKNWDKIYNITQKFNIKNKTYIKIYAKLEKCQNRHKCE